MNDDFENIDWSLTTWEGSRRDSTKSIPDYGVTGRAIRLAKC
jgi:hypothetical protein